MKYLLVLVIASLFSSCSSKMDNCVDSLMDKGKSRSEAKEICEEGRDASVRQ